MDVLKPGNKKGVPKKFRAFSLTQGSKIKFSNFNQFIGFWNTFDLIYQSVCHLLNTDTGGSIYFNISVNDKPTASKSSNKHEQIQEGASILTILLNENHF